LKTTIDIEDNNGFKEVKGKKAAKRNGVPLKKQQFEYRPVRTKPKNVLENPGNIEISKDEDQGKSKNASVGNITSTSMGSAGQSASSSGKEGFGALSSGFLNKKTGGNKKQTGDSPSSSSGKEKSVSVKNAFSVLSNIPEALSEDKVVESNKGKEKLNRDNIFNCVDSDSEVDEVFELDDGLARFSLSDFVDC